MRATNFETAASHFETLFRSRDVFENAADVIDAFAINVHVHEAAIPIAEIFKFEADQKHIGLEGHRPRVREADVANVD